ncbi:MAG: DMT family transporter [Anaerolineales bacterium]|nr:DMT family transporter [Anaerolineales bacterium]
MGELLSILTSFFWAGTSTAFTVSAQIAGHRVVNRSRLLVALVLLVITHFILTGSIIPMGVELDRWLWLGVSGIVGLIVGDHFLLLSFGMLGSHLAMLVFASSPLLSALFAWLAFGEVLSLQDLLGIGFTVGGIILVIQNKRGESETIRDREQLLKGVAAAFLAAAGQALALITAKIGLADGFPAFSAVVMRILVAAAVIWLATILKHEARSTLSWIGRNRYTAHLLVGSIVGPYIGIWFSLLSVQFTTNVGVASALMSLAPIILLPVERFWFGNRITVAAIAGTVLAVLGVFLLIL